MKRLFWLMLTAVLMLGSLNAEAARRLGGGKSIGQQSGNVAQRNTAPAAPSNQAAPNAAPKPATPAAPAPAPKRPWGAMLGGLAAGLGLAWLASSLGMGGALGQVLLFGLLALAVMMVVGWIMRARARPAPAVPAGPLAFEGAGGAAQPVALPRQYSPDHVGNDASARPWERAGAAPEVSSNRPVGSGVVIGSGLSGAQNWGIPAGFDADGFLAAAKRNFVSLQDAWDRSDIPSLRAMMTDSMLTEIKSQLADRESHIGAQVNKTDVVLLEASLLGIEELDDAYMASVEFSGMIREEPSAGPSPFREVWNMTKPKTGNTGWLVAGVQALQ